METLTERIENLMIDHSELAGGLAQQMTTLQAAEYTKEEAEDLIFSEDDWLETSGIEEDSKLWEEVRDLQHDIINEFAIEA